MCVEEEQQKTDGASQQQETLTEGATQHQVVAVLTLLHQLKLAKQTLS